MYQVYEATPKISELRYRIKVLFVNKGVTLFCVNTHVRSSLTIGFKIRSTRSLNSRYLWLMTTVSTADLNKPILVQNPLIHLVFDLKFYKMQ